MKKINLTLDEESINKLKELSKEMTGKENISMAIRILVKNIGKQKTIDFIKETFKKGA